MPVKPGDYMRTPQATPMLNVVSNISARWAKEYAQSERDKLKRSYELEDRTYNKSVLDDERTYQEKQTIDKEKRASTEWDRRTNESAINKDIELANKYQYDISRLQEAAKYASKGKGVKGPSKEQIKLKIDMLKEMSNVDCSELEGVEKNRCTSSRLNASEQLMKLAGIQESGFKPSMTTEDDGGYDPSESYFIQETLNSIFSSTDEGPQEPKKNIYSNMDQYSYGGMGSYSKPTEEPIEEEDESPGMFDSLLNKGSKYLRMIKGNKSEVY